jgi:hypothetical protein
MKGAIIDVSNMNKFVSIELKSLEIKLIILPIYWDLAVYCEILDILVKIRNTKRLRALPTIIGISK